MKTKQEFAAMLNEIRVSEFREAIMNAYAEVYDELEERPKKDTLGNITEEAWHSSVRLYPSEVPNYIPLRWQHVGEVVAKSLGFPNATEGIIPED